MRTRRFIAILSFTIISFASSAQDSFMLRNYIQINKKWNKFSTGLKFENRTNDCWLIRPTFGYSFKPWLKTEASYEFNHSYSKNPCHKAMIGLIGSMRQGNLYIRLRERYVSSWEAVESGPNKHSNVLRSLLSVQYSIPDCIINPFVSVELYTWEKWQKSRHIAGIKLPVDSHNEFEIAYVYMTFANKPSAIHGLNIAYNLDF